MKGADKMNEKIEKLAKIIENQQIQVLKERNSYCEAKLVLKHTEWFIKVFLMEILILLTIISGEIFIHFYPIKNNKNQ